MSQHSKLQKSKAATRTLPEEDPEFQIAPMIDILLVLLVFFMTIATDQVMQVNQEVILPVAKDAETPGKEALNVFVNVLWNLDGTGRIEVDNKGMVDLSGLTDYISKKRQAHDDAGASGKFQVIIRADKRARYQYIRTVMIAVGAAKVPQVIFSAVDKEKPPTPTN